MNDLKCFVKTVLSIDISKYLQPSVFITFEGQTKLMMKMPLEDNFTTLIGFNLTRTTSPFLMVITCQNFLSALTVDTDL